jgi:hypothetical protein
MRAAMPFHAISRGSVSQTPASSVSNRCNVQSFVARRYEPEFWDITSNLSGSPNKLDAAYYDYILVSAKQRAKVFCT